MHIPKVFCFDCLKEMTPRRVGTVIETLDSDNQPYYKVAADVWQCKSCSNVVIIPAAKAIAEHYQPSYADVRPHYQVRFL